MLRGFLCYDFIMLFTKAFEKIAGKLGKLPFRTGLAPSQASALSNQELQRQIRLGRIRYAEIGQAPKVGKSGNPLTAEYMARTYGIKGYKE